MFLSRPPRHPRLVPFVDALWVHSGILAHSHERVLPSGRFQLLINLELDAFSTYSAAGALANQSRGIILQGGRTLSAIVATSDQRHCCGVSFAHGGVSKLFALPAHELVDSIVDFDLVCGAAARSLRDRLLACADPARQLDVLEAALLERTNEVRPNMAVRRACELLTQGASVEHVVNELGLSPRRFIEWMRREVGVNPKLFARLARFQSTLADIDVKRSWSEIAATHGYSDQAHMIREFQAFGAPSPGKYRGRASDARNHVALANGKISSIHAAT